MADRTLRTQPPPRRRPQSKPGRQIDAPKPKRTKVSAARAARRRRVHATVGHTIAEQLRQHTETGRASNTEILVAAFRAEPTPPSTNDGPFAARGQRERKEGVYFFLAPDEIAHIDSMATASGHRTRSALIDAALRAHFAA